jgi:hypothetical protein
MVNWAKLVYLKKKYLKEKPLRMPLFSQRLLSAEFTVNRSVKRCTNIEEALHENITDELFRWNIWYLFTPPFLSFGFFQIFFRGVFVATPAIEHVIMVFINGVMFIPLSRTPGHEN